MSKQGRQSKWPGCPACHWQVTCSARELDGYIDHQTHDITDTVMQTQSSIGEPYRSSTRCCCWKAWPRRQYIKRATVRMGHMCEGAPALPALLADAPLRLPLASQLVEGTRDGRPVALPHFGNKPVTRLKGQSEGQATGLAWHACRCACIGFSGWSLACHEMCERQSDRDGLPLVCDLRSSESINRKHQS